MLHHLLLLILVVLVSSTSLPGLEHLAVNLDDPGNGMLNVMASADHLKLDVNAKIVGRVVNLHDPVVFDDSTPDPQPTFYVKNSKVFRKLCSSTVCSLQEVSPLEAFSHLSFVYHNSNPIWSFNYDWNYDESTGGAVQDFPFGPVVFKDAYVKASSALHIGLEASIGILTEPFEGHRTHNLTSKQLAAFNLYVLGIPIPIKIHLDITAFASVVSTLVVDASFLLKTKNAEMNTGWNSYSGFFFNYTFGDMTQVFKREFEGELNAIAGIDTKLTVNIANSVDFYGIITPFLDATVSLDVCPNELHYTVDFGLDLLLGMSDIVISTRVRDFRWDTARDFLTLELVRHNIIDACSGSVPIDVVASSIPDVARREFLVRVAISSATATIDDIYAWRPATRVATKLCSRSGSTCTINDYIFVSKGSSEKIEFWRQRSGWWSWFDEHLVTFTVTFHSTSNLYGDFNDRRYDFYVTETLSVQPNTYVSTTVTGDESQYFAIDAPHNARWSSRRFLWGGSSTPEMRTFAALTVGADITHLLLDHSRERNIPLPSSRKRTISWSCTKHRKLNVKATYESDFGSRRSVWTGFSF
ncbi:hypothetical protein GEMRC1_000568 [Eukaryota sp. GEM-RC1]